MQTPDFSSPSTTAYARMITKADGRIDWNEPAEKIERIIRGMNSWPGAYSDMKNAYFSSTAFISSPALLLFFSYSRSVSKESNLKSSLLSKIFLPYLLTASVTEAHSGFPSASS